MTEKLFTGTLNHNQNKKLIILGDFNGQYVIRGSDDVNERGRIIEKFRNKNKLCLFNDNKPTYLDPATGTYTSLNLSICYPTLLLDYEWKVHDDLCGSDHFPIFLNNNAIFLNNNAILIFCYF